MANRVENAKDLTDEQVREIAAIVRVAVAEPCEFIPLNGCGRVYMHIGYSKIMKGYADEDMGNNCGAFVLLNGEIVEHYIAPGYRYQTEEVREIWRRFACDVRGRNYDDYYGEGADE